MSHVEADRDRCQGYAHCVVNAPDVFDMGEDNKVLVLDTSNHEPSPEVIDAVDSCPVGALRLT
jgi:ferredoxin